MSKNNGVLILILVFFHSAYSKDDVNTAVDARENILYEIFNPNSNDAFLLSPNGEMVSYTEFDGRNLKLLSFDIHNKIEYQLINDRIDSGLDIVEYSWADSSNIIVTLRNKFGELTLEIFSIDASASKKVFTRKKLVDNYFVFDSIPSVKNKVILGRLSDGETLLYSYDLTSRKKYKQLRSKYRINRGATANDNWLSDRNGNIVISHKEDDGNHKIYYRSPLRKNWELIYELENVEYFRPALFDSVNNQLLFFRSTESEGIKLYSFSVNSKVVGEPIAALKSKSVEKILVDKYNSKILGVTSVVKGVSNYEMFDSSTEIFINDVSDVLKTDTVYIVDSDLKNSNFILLDYASNKPGKFYIFEKKSSNLNLLKHRQPNLKDWSFKSSRVFYSKSSDGVQVESYFTPAENESSDAPLLVMPHGGPHGVRDLRYFDKTVQSFSKLGYSVLQVNYRGSWGYGKEFLELGKQQWGRLIEDDIASATENILEKKLAKKSNVCIYGISYGGYSALMSGIQYPELYSCAISYAGVTDLTLIFNEHSVNINEELKAFYLDYVGNPDADIQELMKYSPVYRAKDINIPILLGQGGDDVVVDLEHYFRLLNVLDMLNIKYEQAFYQSETHGFDKVRNHVDFLSRLDKFILKSTH